MSSAESLLVCRVCRCTPDVVHEGGAMIARCPRCKAQKGIWGDCRNFLAKTMCSTVFEESKLPVFVPRIQGVYTADVNVYRWVDPDNSLTPHNQSFALVRTSHPHPFVTDEGWECILNESRALHDCVLIDPFTGHESEDLCAGIYDLKQPSCRVYLSENSLRISVRNYKWEKILMKKINSELSLAGYTTRI